MKAIGSFRLRCCNETVVEDSRMNDAKCKHDACHCTGEEVQNSGYCSQACQTGAMENDPCACGHPDCK